MRCPFCGKHSDANICPFCGMDKSLEAKIRHTADRFYREAYARVTSGDLSTAADLLEKALFYNGKDTRTLNLLGLIRYRTGEIGDAMRLWERSVELDERRDNKARGHLADVRKRETRLRAKLEAVRLYNEALEQCKSGSLDYAIARLKKAGSLSRHNVRVQLLLALCYIEQGRYKAAIACLDKVKRVDPLHPVLARYRKWITDLAEQGETDAEDDDIQDVSETHSIRQALTEPDLNEIFGSGKNRRVRLRNWHTTLSQIGMFIMGAACMFAFIYTLRIPDELSRLRQEAADMREEVAQKEEAAAQMQQDMLKAQQYEYEAEQRNTELKRQVDQLTQDLDTMGAVDMDDALARAVITYLNGSYSDLIVELDLIDRESLTEDGKKLYDILAGALNAGAADLYESGTEDFFAAQEADGEEQEKLLSQAYLKLNRASSHLEEETHEWWMASYYLGCVLYWQGQYQEAQTLAQDLMNRYWNVGDEYYNLLVSLNNDAEEALNGGQ